MFKRIFARKAARKYAVFLSVFILSVASMGNWIANRSDQDALQKSAFALASSKQMSIATPEYIEDLVQPTGFTVKKADDKVDTDRKSQGVIASDRAGNEREPKDKFVYLQDLPMSAELQEYTYQLCEDKNLDYTLVLALMWRESRFQTNAVNLNTNGTYDSGIMQINDVNKGWLRELGIEDLMDPEQNIEAGVIMLSTLTEKYGTHNALMAYQYGEAGMKRKIEQGVTTNRSIQVLYGKRNEFRIMIENDKRTHRLDKLEEEQGE